MTVWPAGLLVVILLTVATITAERRSVRLCPCTRGCCDEHWYQYKDACYRPGSIPQLWNEAERSCSDQDAHLASVHTHEEDKFIFHLMGRPWSYWLGAEKIDRSERGRSYWKWSDNSTWDYASMKLRSKSHRFGRDRVIVERSGSGGDDDDEGRISWDYETTPGKRHLFVCKYLLL